MWFVDLHEFKTKQEKREREKRESEGRKKMGKQDESKSDLLTSKEPMEDYSSFVIPELVSPVGKKQKVWNWAKCHELIYKAMIYIVNKYCECNHLVFACCIVTPVVALWSHSLLLKIEQLFFIVSLCYFLYITIVTLTTTTLPTLVVISNTISQPHTHTTLLYHAY